VDARTLSPSGCCDRGIGHYAAYHLEALALEQPTWIFLLFLDDPEERTWALDRLFALPNVQARLFRDLPHTRMDLFHIPDLMVKGQRKGMAPSWEELRPGTPYSVIFYDLIPLVLRKEFIDHWAEGARNDYLRRLERLKRSKALILTISQHTKRDLGLHLDIEAARMVPIMAGLNLSADAAEPSQEQIQAVLKAQGLDRPFFLVVGALDPHKRFSTTLNAFVEVLKTRPVQLVVVGSLSNPITRAYKEAFEEKGITGIRFTGFVSREDLECLYRAARGLAFPSAYEGFGFPVLEAMSQCCPVITSRASSLPEVAGDAALLVSPDDPAEMAKAMRRLLEEPQLRDTLIQRGLEQASRFSWRANAQATLEAWGPLLNLPGRTGLPAEKPTAAGAIQARTTLRWEGSQFVWHSLAHVNRQLCLGLLASGAIDLSLIPYEADQFNPAGHPAFLPLSACVNKRLAQPAAVHVRHQWPPNFTPPKEGAWVVIQPWEYGGIPQTWVSPMRDLVDEIWVPSTWVKDCYVDSGIPSENVKVIPNGVDTRLFTPEGPAFPLRTTRRVKFLFLGGTISRKGIDVLLKAYSQAFRASDDVCLVIKGQGGHTYLGSDLSNTLAQLRQDDPEAPDIEYFSDDLDEAALASLYRACDVFVMPYRGEGFGLPMAEALASGRAVIATARGAAMDFLAEDRAYFIPCERRRIETVGEFRPSAPGFWLEEPDPEGLVALLRHAAAHPEEVAAKGRQARVYAEAHLGWEGPARLVLERVQALATVTPIRFRATAARRPLSEIREAFLMHPDWSRAHWAEILLAFVAAFQPGEPVGLVVFLQGSGVTLEAAQEQVLGLLAKAGRQTFPDVELVDQPADIMDTLKRYGRFQWVPEDVATDPNPVGLRAKRLLEARLALRG
jgi:glycosyltransferase involved in cell wall biosynthesis